MQARHLFDTIDTHTAGEPTRILLNENLSLGRKQVIEQREVFKREYDWIRELLLLEPRGHSDMFGATMVESQHNDADFGMIFMDSDGYLDMCGHGTMGAVTALIESGRVSPEPEYHIETPAGIVEARPTIVDGSVDSVTVTNVDSFVYDSLTIDVEQKRIEVDIVYAGNFFAMVDSDTLGIPLTKDNKDEFLKLGIEIRDKVNDQLNIQNPETGDGDSVDLTEFYQENEPVDKSTVVFGSGQIDRSPCGSGTCAKLALLHKQGKLNIGEKYIYESLIGTQFEGKITEYTSERGFEFVAPEVTGSAYITGKHTFVLDPADPLTGFNL